MVASKKARPRFKKKVGTKVGLLANGSAGSWDVAVDGSSEGVDAWFLQIESPSVYLNVEIDSPVEIERLLNFLRQTSGGPDFNSRSPQETETLQLAKMGRTPVCLLQDNEIAGRFFFLLRTAHEATLRLTFSNEDRQMLIDALTQVRDDLRRNGSA